MESATLEERVGKFDSLSNAIRDFPDSEEYKSLKAGLIDRANQYFKKDDKLQPEIKIDENTARAMARDFWNYVAEYVAKDYLKWTDGEIDAKKKTNDPASRKPVFDTVITDIVGTDEDGIYNTLKTRGSVTAENANTLVSPIYENHDRRDTSKRTAQGIKDNMDADAALGYLSALKGKYPKSLAPLSIPKTYQSIADVQGLVATAARAVPRDYPIQIAKTYKEAA